MTQTAAIPNIELPMDAIIAFCKKWNIVEFALFGSVLRDDFRPDSDIDVLVKYREGAPFNWFILHDMTEEIKALFGREVDLISRRAIEQSRNYLRRKEILGTAKVIYAE